jgi:DNA-binding transcriptional regulator YdaS (Cro superfamily)
MRFRTMTLGEWMTLHGYNDERMAELIGVNQSTVNRIRNGVQKPSGQTIVRVEEVTKGQVNAADFFRRNNVGK